MNITTKAPDGNYGPFLLSCMVDVRDGVATVIPVGNDGYVYTMTVERRDDQTDVSMEMSPAVTEPPADITGAITDAQS